MPCEKCGKVLLIDNEKEICAFCSDLKLLPRLESEQISDFRIGILNRLFSRYINQINKYKLVVYLMFQREKIASEFFQGQTHGIRPYDLLAINILVKRVMQYGNPKGSTDIEISEDFIDLFARFLQVCEENIFINEGVGFYTYKRNIPFENLTGAESLSNYWIVYREEWKYIMKSYGNELFMNQEAAEAYMKKYKKEYDKIKTKPRTKTPYSPKDFIERAFPAVNSFHSILQKNVLFASMFNFEYLKDCDISLTDIHKIFGAFPTRDSKLMFGATLEEFDSVLDGLKLDKNLIKTKMLMEDNNAENKIFPFFTKVGDGKKEMILVTPNFFRVMFIAMHPVFHKEIFDSVKDRRGKSIEKGRAKEEFEKVGYTYIPNITDKKKRTLEIDGVAYKDSFAYICEIKSWNIRPFFDQLKVHGETIRDLKGVVDGKKFTTKDGVLITIEKPSLHQKIEYIRNNKIKHKIPDNVNDFRGIVVTSLVPIVKEYKGIKFVSIDELQKL